jgi:hypothetical protein
MSQRKIRDVKKHAEFLKWTCSASILGTVHYHIFIWGIKMKILNWSDNYIDIYTGQIAK